jgi:hypothetical protein
MGGRRKGEVSPAQLDREWPHQGALPRSRCVGRQQGEQLKASCKGLSLGPRRHAVVIDDIWHNVFCFAKPDDAAAFRERFGGVTFDPKRRARGQVAQGRGAPLLATCVTRKNCQRRVSDCQATDVKRELLSPRRWQVFMR